MNVGELKEFLKDKDNNLDVVCIDNEGNLEYINEADTDIIRDKVDERSDTVVVILK